MRAARALSLACLAGACSGSDAPEPLPEAELSPVVREALSGLPDPGALDSVEPADPEEVDSLVEMLNTSTARMRDIPRGAVAEELGAAAIPRLTEILRDPSRDSPTRLAAAELLSVIGDRRAAAVMVDALYTASEPWIRQWSAFYLGEMGQDWIVPDLLLRMRYEKDPGTFVWIASALARFQNFSGLDALLDVANAGSTEELRAQARGQLDGIASRVGAPIEEVRATWFSIDAPTRLPQPSPTPALRRAVWERVSQLSSEHFQLRGVDDSRYALSRMGPWIASEIAPALFDEDAHVRLHVAQVLERLGPRAQVAGPHLVAAMAEPRIAPAIAEALGRVGYPPALESLQEASAAGRPHELRVAASYALGRLNLQEALPTVTALFDDQSAPPDLRMGAATALVLLEAGDHAASWLVGELGAERDPAAAERALETWLVQGTEAERPGFVAARQAWDELTGPPGVIPSLDQTRERWSDRSECLAELVGELVR